MTGFVLESLGTPAAAAPPVGAPKSGGGFVLESLPEQRSASADVDRGGGLGLRAVIESAFAVPNMALNAGIGIGNAINSATNAAGITDAAKMPSASELTSQFLTKLGLPEAATSGERISSEVLGAMTGTGLLAKAANALKSMGILPEVERRVMDVLSKSVGVQVAGAGTGQAASSGVRESGGGIGSQLAAGAAASLIPAGAQAGGAAAVRAAVRGGEQGRQAFQQRLDAFTEAGVEAPSVGQVSGNRAIQSAETGLSHVSASAGVMDRAAEREARDMGARVEALADSLIPKASATKAGIAIETGLKQFVTRFRGELNFLYNKVDRYIPAETRVTVDRTREALADLNMDIPGAPELSKWFKNAKIQGIEAAVAKDAAATPAKPIMSKVVGPDGQPLVVGETAAQPGGVPYQALKQLRTLVGREMDNSSLVSDVPRSKWKTLYGALSQDMEAAAAAAGPEATRAFKIANGAAKAGHARIDDILDRVSGGDTAERVFRAAVNPSEIREGGTTVGTVMKSLKPDERKVVTATVIRRLGLATPGQQDNLGERFSSRTFLTNWNTISPEAKAHLFTDQTVRSSLDKIAEASNMIQQGSKVFANPSGTAPALSNQMTAWSLVGSAVTGRWDVFAAIGAGLVGGNISARLLTNPQFVKWLAKTTTMPPAALPGAVQQMTQHVNSSWRKEDRDDFNQYITEVAAQAGQQPERQP